MSLILTFWERPRNWTNAPGTEDDFDGILEIRLKSVKQIPELLAAMPKHCAMVSTEHSGDHRQRGKITNPQNPRYFKEIWRKGQPIPQIGIKKCPLCGCTTVHGKWQPTSNEQYEARLKRK